MPKKFKTMAPAVSPVLPKKSSFIPASSNVRVFCRLLADALDDERWGDIEPGVFENIANGVTSFSEDDEFYCDKMDSDEMRSAVESIQNILERVLPQVLPLTVKS